MKKYNCIFFAAVLVSGLLLITANAQATEAGAPMIQLSGLIEVGAVWQDIDYQGTAPTVEDVSDLCLTTVELTAEAEMNEWVNVGVTLLYEDPTFGDETHLEVDMATVTIGNTEEYPLYCTAGKMYVPFGALLTHFPDDPLLEAPLTLLLGETLEKAFLVGFEQAGFSVSAYGFNGEVDEFGEDNNIESYGVDANFSFDDEAGFDLLVGGSYISNISDSDGLTEALHAGYTALEESPLISGAGLKDYVAGAAGYVHVGFAGFFVDGEYMAALDEFDIEETLTAGGTAEVKGQDKPTVWNVEAGYNLDWGKNLEIVFKYAGSDEAEALGYPETRYGLCLNQDLFEDVVVSLGYLRDDYDEDKDDYEKDGTTYHRDDKDLVFAQIAIEF
jgi:hypothetical protein